MFGSEVLDVLIGLAFIYLLLSLVASAVREGLESILKARAVHLERAIREMLDDTSQDGLVAQLYNHPLVFSLFPGKYKFDSNRKMGKTLPTFIPPKAFATTLLDLVVRGAVDDSKATNTTPPVARPIIPELTIDRVRAAIPQVTSVRVKRMLTLVTDGAADMNDVVANTEQWFNDCMDHVSAIYRRRTQWGLLIIGLVIAGSLNIDSIAIANHLVRSKGAREALVTRAETYLTSHTDSANTGSPADSIKSASAGAPTGAKPAVPLDSTKAVIERQIADLRSLDLPLGWDYVMHPPGNAPPSDLSALGWITRIFGIIITVFAVSLGAPFWFDALKRITSIRSTGKPVDDEDKSDTKRTKQTIIRSGTPPPPASSGQSGAASTG
ncbi:MAG: hypothetical protein U0132_02070 [Gemmatimonadaceae bacterium]